MVRDTARFTLDYYFLTTHYMQKNTPIQTYQAYPSEIKEDKKAAKKRVKARKIVSPTPRMVRWWFPDGAGKLAIIFFLLLLATLLLFFISNPPSVSPLINSYLDLLNEHSTWAIPVIGSRGNLSFVLSLAFVIVLTSFLWLTYRLCLGSYLEPAPDDPDLQTRYFSLRQPPHQQTALRIVTILYILMMVSNVLLFFYFDRRLSQPELPLESTDFRIVYFLAILSRLFGVFIGIGSVLQLFLQDFGKPIGLFLGRYLRYFYPAILAIAIVGFVFTKMDQFDSLFIELVNSPGNFLLFSLFFFPASLVIIWFSPNYLIFTDQQFSNRFKTWDILDRLHDDNKKYRQSPGLMGWAFFHKRLFPQLDRLDEKSPPKEFMPKATGIIAYPPSSFHRFRAFLGLMYILLLVGICGDIYFGNQTEAPAWSSYLVLLTALLTLLYIIFSLRITNLSQLPENEVIRKFPQVDDASKLSVFSLLRDRAGDRRNRKQQVYQKTRETVFFVEQRWSFFLGLGVTAAAFLLFVVTLVLILAGASWDSSFRWFLGFLVLSVFSFAWLAVYRPFYQGYTFNLKDNGEGGRPTSTNRFPSDAVMDRLDHLTVQTMLMANPLLALLATAFFLVGLFWEGFVSSSFVSWLNPLNIYLLLINGLLASIILIDRLLMLRDLRQKYRSAKAGELKQHLRSGMVSSSSRMWGLAIIGVLLGTAYLGNTYHEIRYVTTTANNEAPDLETYVTNFLQAAPAEGPVILVAADGGGLKACYWTMLNLLALDEQGQFDGHVFALSGASGGTIGLSMYNYLKSRGKSKAQIREYIEKIGRGNYLSGDFTGLLTRFPINYWPDLPGFEPHRWDDRMEGMARSYFNIVGDGGDGHDYGSVRKEPFWTPWIDTPSLPLLIINTARAEDGLLGTVIPLKENPLTGSIDLNRNSRGQAISYPDATFLSNRFPIASPAARITGKGHFLDAGSADNSGLNSIYSLLRTLKSRELADTSNTVYRQLFDRGVVVISLRNAASRYARDAFIDDLDKMNRYPYKSELSANSGVAVNTGLTGVPISWDDYLRGETVRNLGLIDQYHTVNLPFRLRKGDVFSALGGELKLTDLDRRRDSLNHLINEHLGRDSSFAVMPPLGRLLAEPTRRYMDIMVDCPQVKAVYEDIREFRK
ncbi:hypothetical protein SAMN05444359_10781 [Neolewinella agarilytica]|uniref:Patatin-like phospholipase n=2 Tax=Neolewinella agarilytica TaxID=478744 RepID=A0A1H9EJD5_9BACT|nr:hypothetical protein SAMN05444359_10781 [Neolewinella agarilytica]